MTDLDAYIGQAIGIITSNRGDERETALRVRKLTQAALDRDAFLLACMDRILSSLEKSPGRWRNPPLYFSSDPPVMIRVFYWPPGYQNSPHLHRTWTVTGVLYNEIVVETFKEATAVCDSLGPSVSIAAHAGNVGYLLPPCVHYLHNSSQLDSATMHVFSTDDQYGSSAAEAPRLLPVHEGAAAPMNIRRRALYVLSGMLARVREHAAVERLLRIFAMGDAAVKMQAIKALIKHDAPLACEKSRELEATLRGQDREALSRINAALAMS